MGESLHGHLTVSKKSFLQQVTHQLTTGLKASYRFGPLLSPVEETAHMRHMKHCLGMLSNLIKVWEAQCPAVVPFPHIQHSAGIHFLFKRKHRAGIKVDCTVGQGGYSREKNVESRDAMLGVQA